MKKKFFGIAIGLTIGIGLVGFYIYDILKVYTPPNVTLESLAISDSIKVFYSSTDSENTTRLYSQNLNGQDKKELYQHNPRFQFRLIKFPSEGR